MVEEDQQLQTIDARKELIGDSKNEKEPLESIMQIEETTEIAAGMVKATQYSNVNDVHLPDH